MNAIDSFKHEHNGKIYAVEIFPDEDNLAPWENEDGHGPVTDWETRDKAPGELVLCDDNPTGLRSCTARRFYGFAEARKVALEDSWGVPAYRLDFEQGANALHRATGQWFTKGRELQSFRSDWHDNVNAAVRQVYEAHRATYPSRKAYAAAAARADYERLRAWCNGEWWYVGVVVRPGDACSCCGPSVSVWGIESDSKDYIRTDVVPELIEELEARGEQSCAV